VTVIDLGTRRTRTSEQADHVMLMKPQGDLAIANCIANQLVASASFDKEFVSKHCNFRGDTDPPTLLGKPITFEEYKAKLAD
jgi:nitrate reductase NapA